MFFWFGQLDETGICGDSQSEKKCKDAGVTHRLMSWLTACVSQHDRVQNITVIVLYKPLTASIKPITTIIESITTLIKPITTIIKPITTIIKPKTTIIKSITTLIKPLPTSIC